MPQFAPPAVDRDSLYRVVKKFGLRTASRRVPVSVIVPCYNEEEGLDSLAVALADVVRDWPEYDWRYIFVDDASTDATSSVIARQFADCDHCAVLRHHENQGITGAILSGIDFAETEIVCSIDSDCTYDPRDLGHLVRMIEAGNDMITASPYHPQGEVAGVPAWRLVLSKAASTLYRLTFWANVYTFTACYRAHRRSTMRQLDIENQRYGGLAEMLLKTMIAGGRVGEFPAVLRVRQFGQSKMKVVRTIGSHLALMARLLPRSWRAAHLRQQAIPVTTPRLVVTPSLPTAATNDRQPAGRKAA
ncbi:MAG: glycosyltransferase family 2 protein [Planctomycetaceae bacterium]